MTERLQRFFAFQVEQDAELGPRQVRIRASTEALGRDNLVVLTRGIDIEPYKSNPVMLWQHNRNEPAIARAVDVSTANNELVVLAQFAEEGTSERADEICGLVKQGIINGISAGLDVLDAAPIDPKNRSAGRCITKSELLEISFVNVQAERNSLVTGRSDGEDEAHNENAVDTSDTVDTCSTTESVIERAGAKFSAASKAKMDECRGHIDNAMRCLREMMDDGGDEMRAAGIDGAAADGSIAVAVLTPAERFRRQLEFRSRAA